MASETGATVIGRSAVLRGDLSAEGDLQIDGALEGTVQLGDARITVGPDARVRAVLRARDIVVYGRVEGDLRASGRVELRSTAFVLGDVYAGRFAMEQEAVLQGHVDAFDSNAPGSAARASASDADAVPARGASAEASQPTTGTFAASRPSSAIPSGLAAAAASVAGAQRPLNIRDGAETQMPQPAWAAEPKQS